MFKALNQVEMLNVNGGFYYVPVYNKYYDKFIYRNKDTKALIGVSEKYLYTSFSGHTEQVASDSGISALYRKCIRYTYTLYV